MKEDIDPFESSMVEDSRILFLVGEIDAEVARKFLIGLHLLDKGKGDITIVLCSDGGFEAEGYAMFSAIRACKNRTIIKVYGECMSTAAIILQAATVRLMDRYATLMLHHGSIDEVQGDHARNIERLGSELQRMRMQFLDVLAKRSGLKKSYWSRKLEFDCYLSADQAKKVNLIDKII
jgi:ATP-dependent Clp protease protease subunit